jgi:hypothetical protein
MWCKKKLSILFVLIFAVVNMMAQVEFARTIEKRSCSDTVIVSFKLNKFQPGEMCRIQQKIPTAFKLIDQNILSDTIYYDKDVATSLWLSLPSDTTLQYQIRLLAPQKSLGFIYLGDCACFYGGKIGPATRKYIPKEKVWMSDSILIPTQDTLLFAQIDSISQIKPVILKKGKGKKARQVVAKSPYSFRIQITATKFKQDLKDMSKDVVSPDQIFVEQTDDFYKYTIGSFKSYKQAKERLALYQQRKMNGYIVAYKNGVRVGIKEASAVEESEIIEQ